MLPSVPDIKEQARENIAQLSVITSHLLCRIEEHEQHGPGAPELSEPDFFELMGRVLLANEEMTPDQTAGVMAYQLKTMREGIAMCEQILALPDDATLDMMPGPMIESYNEYMRRLGNASG